MKKLAQIEYLDIAEDSSYESIIEKVTEACFTEENLLDAANGENYEWTEVYI